MIEGKTCDIKRTLFILSEKWQGTILANHVGLENGLFFLFEREHTFYFRLADKLLSA